MDDKRRDGKGKILGGVTCIVWCAGGEAELWQRGEPPPSSLQRRLPERLTGYPVGHSCRHPPKCSAVVFIYSLRFNSIKAVGNPPPPPPMFLCVVRRF